MSDVLSVLGAAPVLYTYLLSARQRAQFSHPDGVRFPVSTPDGLALRPLDEAPLAGKTKLNWIFEFDAGDAFFETAAADASRFIAASRPDEFDLHTPVDGHAAELGERVGCAVLSGYHGVKRQYDDGRTFEECLDNARSVVEGVAANARVQVELGVTHDPEIRRAVRERIVPAADVVSLDDHELNQVRDDLDLTEPSADAAVVRRYETLDRARESLGLDAVSFHAKGYFLAVFDDASLPADAVRRGFEFAACVAAAKAEDGVVTGPADVEGATAYPRSAAGREAVGTLGSHLDTETVDDVIETPGVVAVPNRVVDAPASTVGIGDAVSVTSFAVACATADRG
jgi:ADP-dependent phosphofructokinase/glucokinase